MTFAMRDKLENIQILRAVAACMVLASHIGTELVELAGRRGLASGFEITPWATGVDIFFVLSGFLMLVTAADEAGRPSAAAAFIGRRIARIAPLYWLLTTALVLGSIALPGMLHMPIGDAPHVVASYAFWPSLRGDEIRPVLALGWTLEYEMFFYVLFALALILPRGWTVPALTGLMLGVVAAGEVLKPSGVAMQFWSSPIILEFLLGVGCAVLYRRGLRLTSAQGGVLVAVGLILLLLSGDAAAQRQSWLPLASVGLPALLVVAGAALSPSAGDGLFARIGIEIGAASYSLYLLHPFILRTLRVLWDRFEPPLGLFWIVAAVLVVLGSILLRRLVEDPMNRWAKGLVTGSRRRAPLQAAE
jgi:exopolysaccharide production protein ExoZ